MSKEEKIQAMIKILKACNINMSVSGCGCCGSPSVSFGIGDIKILDEADNINFNTDSEQDSE